MPDTTTLTPERRAELKRLYETATPGPWDSVVSSYRVRYLGRTLPDLPHGADIAHVDDDCNRHFIAAAHNAFPALLALADERDELAKRVAELEAEVETIRRYGNKDCTAMADAELTTKGDR